MIFLHTNPKLKYFHFLYKIALTSEIQMLRNNKVQWPPKKSELKYQYPKSTMYWSFWMIWLKHGPKKSPKNEYSLKNWSEEVIVLWSINYMMCIYCAHVTVKNPNFMFLFNIFVFLNQHVVLKYVYSLKYIYIELINMFQFTHIFLW